MKTAIVTGSYDPITTGHFDLIKRASELFPRVIVAVLDNTEKRFLFNTEKRFLSVKACFSHNANITVRLWNGLLADLVLQTENPVIVRGARNTLDFEYERILFEINRELADAESIILPAKKEYEFISSTFVRELIKYKRPLTGYVPDKAIEILNKE
ncbi:MAG: pantetheine-phosphate adenylyltransferase [Clostridiales bacterium GWF2_36_10]|nr:MAG: pantetheine-phosphate adenylyltransferase [Clostridiales bacterium GWF2_36_10]HAN20267.1 pantetheine-phosphate adenylyltransferase [Clostridiales bacterium]